MISQVRGEGVTRKQREREGKRGVDGASERGERAKGGCSRVRHRAPSLTRIGSCRTVLGVWACGSGRVGCKTPCRLGSRSPPTRCRDTRSSLLHRVERRWRGGGGRWRIIWGLEDCSRGVLGALHDRICDDVCKTGVYETVYMRGWVVPYLL